MLSMEEIRKSQSERQAQQAAKPKLSDFAGKKVITTLPGGSAYEATITAVLTTDDALTLHVTTKELKGEFQVPMRVNNFFEDLIAPLFYQLDMPSIDFEALKKCVGQNIIIAAVDTLKDGNIYTNYRFDINSIKNLLPPLETAEAPTLENA